MTTMKIHAASAAGRPGPHPVRPLDCERPAWTGDEPWVFLLTCYMLGGPAGRNLGAPGYSHDFVAQLFRPLLEQWGEVIEIQDAPRDLQGAVDACLRQGKRPVHFSVLPFQDVCLAAGAANVAARRGRKSRKRFIADPGERNGSKSGLDSGAGLDPAQPRRVRRP